MIHDETILGKKKKSGKYSAHRGTIKNNTKGGAEKSMSRED